MTERKENLKFCRDCKYYIDYYQCWHPKNTAINLIEGREYFKESCTKLRNNGFKCGEEGHWFEVKELVVNKSNDKKSWWQKFKEKLWWDLK